MKKKNYVGYVLFTVILTIGIINILTPSIRHSIYENRDLQVKPQLSVESIKDESYFKDYNKYVEDQFVERPFWMGLKTKFEKLIGVKKIDNIYFGKNNRLVEEAVIPSDDFINRRIKNINNLINKNEKLNFQFILVPNKIGIYYKDVSKTNKQEDLYNKFIKNLSKDFVPINTFDILNKYKDEYIYFNTDHHYTSLGAKYISEAFLNNKNIKYSKYLVNNDFYGTDSNKIAFYKKPDYLEIYKRNDIVSYYLTYNNDGKEYSSIYAPEKQFTNNPYEIFFGGNTSLINIKTTSKNKRKLLVIKDSYANAFIPYMINDYREIVIIDPRYFYDDLNNIIKEKDITDIMLYYNMNTFFEDVTFDKMIESIDN